MPGASPARTGAEKIPAGIGRKSSGERAPGPGGQGALKKAEMPGGTERKRRMAVKREYPPGYRRQVHG